MLDSRYLPGQERAVGRGPIGWSPTRRGVLAVAGGAVLAALAPPPVGAQEDGKAAALAQAVHDRPTGRDMATVGRMELTEPGRSPRVRELVTYRLNKGGGETTVLVRFLEPPDIAGTGLLSVDKPDGTNEQWLYLPALDRVRRVSGDRKGGRFVGSDIFFEDLQERKPDRDAHRLTGRDTLDGVVVEVMDSRPLQAGDSVYRRRLSWVDASTALVHRIDYFEKDEAVPSKRWQLLQRRQVQGYWVVTESLMTDLRSGHQTRMTVERVRFDRGLPAKLFSTQALADDSLEAQFRP